jgi:hypothetical protein
MALWWSAAGITEGALLKLRGSFLALGLGVSMGLASHGASAQMRTFPRLRYADQKERANPRNEFNPEPKNNGGALKGQANLRAMAGLPPRWIENLREMPPAEQERFLRNNRLFQNMVPERQAQIRKNLENWNKLSPEQRNQIRERAEIIERMTPQQRQYVRNTLLPKWQGMAPERRQLINGRLRILQSMGPGAQQAALADPKFMQGLSPDEQAMLRDLNSFRNPLP